MEQQLFSIVIPSWNNLAFLKLCVESIRKNSTYRHQIVVHVNEGTDGTLEWVREQGLDYTYSPQNIGVCFSMNLMRTKVKTDYILFLNDDMYVLPEWDKVLYDEVKRQKDNIFSSQQRRFSRARKAIVSSWPTMATRWRPFRRINC